MIIFYNALTKGIGNEDLLSNLYKDSIKLYGKKPTFEFLINIFVKVYNNIDLYPLILKEFKNTLEKDTQKNEIVIEKLKTFKENFQEICEKSKDIIQKNS